MNKAKRKRDLDIMTLKKVRESLNKYYTKFNFYNKSKVFDEVLYIFLSWRTPIPVAESLYQRLKVDYRDWNELIKLNETDWYKILKSSGKANDKARILVKLLKKIKEDFGRVENVQLLSGKPDNEVHEYLISLPGIKDKSAYCVMLYSMERAVFPADAHCLRVSQRLGIIEGTNYRKQDRVQGQKMLNELVKGDYHLCYDLHITMLQHGRKICKKNPLCQECVISKFCSYYTSNNTNEAQRN